MIFSKIIDIEQFSSALDEKPPHIQSGVDFYNSDFSAYGNEIYREVSSRVAHWLNFQEQGWFAKRLSYYLDNYGDYDLVIDLGFSVPYVYARHDVAVADTRFLFIDKYESAKSCFDAIRTLYEISRKDDSVMLADIEHDATVARVCSVVNDSREKSILIVGSEIVEHLSDPQCFWAIPRRLAETGYRVDCFVTLPIGKKIPSHTIEFRSNEEADQYLQNFLTRKHTGRLFPPTAAISPYLESCVWRLGEFCV